MDRFAWACGRLRSAWLETSRHPTFVQAVPGRREAESPPSLTAPWTEVLSGRAVRLRLHHSPSDTSQGLRRGVAFPGSGVGRPRTNRTRVQARGHPMTADLKPNPATGTVGVQYAPRGLRTRAQGCAVGATLGWPMARRPYPNGVVAVRTLDMACRGDDPTPSGLGRWGVTGTQGSASSATLGSGTESRWDRGSTP